jgi:hypothetical protein
MTPGELNCGIIIFVILFICIFLHTISRFWYIVEFFENHRVSKSPIAYLRSCSTAFSDFSKKFLQKHIEEFVLSAPSEPFDTGIVLKQMLVEVEILPDAITFTRIPLKTLEEIFFPRKNMIKTNRITFYLNLIREIVTVSLCGPKISAQVSANYLSPMNGLFPSPIRQPTNNPGETLVSKLQRIRSIGSEPTLDSVQIFRNTIVISSSGSTSFLFFDKFHNNTLCMFRELSTGIFGFEDSVSPECMICCDTVATSLLIPCGHTSTCETCTRSFRDTKCPICRSKFSSRIFLPIRDTRPPTGRHGR